ncbi:uncharacterized protein V6R79_009370 [Siganus canaliculatus]
MASCLIPDFPAVMVALEHLKELDKQLRDDGVPFSPEASLRLTEVTASITELEAERRATHEQLEVKTIENSKLRQQINNLRERMTQEFIADVAAARAANAEEIEQLHIDIIAVTQLQDATMKKQEALSSHNKELYPERDKVKAEHQEVIAALDDQITFNSSLQKQLEQTQKDIEELKSCIAAVEEDKLRLQQSTALNREAFAVKKDNLSTEMIQIKEKCKQQKHENRRSKRTLDKVSDKKQKKLVYLYKLTADLAKLECNLQNVTASRRQCEAQLEEETQKHQELRQQREMLQKKLQTLGEEFSIAVQRLHEEIATVESKIAEGQAASMPSRASLAHIYDIFKCQLNEENEIREENLYILQRLQKSKLQLEEQIASLVQHNSEIKAMEKQISDLLDADIINKRVFEKNQEEMCDNVDANKKNICRLEKERRRLTDLLEETKRKQEEYVSKMISDIRNTRRRYQELQEEEAALQQQRPMFTEEELMNYLSQCERKYRQEETKHLQETDQCITEIESVERSNEEKQREVEEKEKRLKEVEAVWRGELSKQESVKTLNSELRKKRNVLQLSTERLEQETGSVLKSKEEVKADLQVMRCSYLNLLGEQASELRAVEHSIYDKRAKLEEVSMENSRLQLAIIHMTEDASRAREDKERYERGLHQFGKDTKVLSDSLQEAWKEDLVVSQDWQKDAGALLVSMSATIDFLKTRRGELGRVRTLLQQQILDFSRRLGNKISSELQNVSADL